MWGLGRVGGVDHSVVRVRYANIANAINGVCTERHRQNRKRGKKSEVANHDVSITSPFATTVGIYYCMNN